MARILLAAAGLLVLAAVVGGYAWWDSSPPATEPVALGTPAPVAAAPPAEPRRETTPAAPPAAAEPDSEEVAVPPPAPLAKPEAEMKEANREAIARHVEILEETYDDPSEDAQAQRLLARDFLVAAGPPAVRVLLESAQEADPNFSAEVQTVLAEMGEEAIPPLMEALKHPEDGVREQAARSLGAFGSEAVVAVEALLEVSLTQNMRLGITALRSIVEIGEPAIPTLVKHLHNEDRGLQFGAIWTLGEMGTKAGIAADPMRALLDLEDDWMRNQVEIALDKIERTG